MASVAEEGLGQRLIAGGGACEAEARDDYALWAYGHEQLEALVPPQAVGPPDVRVSGKPPRSPALGVPNDHRRAVECFEGASAELHHPRQIQGELLDELRVRTHEAVELGTVGQGGEGSAQEVGVSVAIGIPLAGEPGEAGEDGEGYDLAGAEGGVGSGASVLCATRLVEVVRSEVECSEEGVHVEHERSVPFPPGSGSKPTLERGHFPLKFRSDNSHQAFKECFRLGYTQAEDYHRACDLKSVRGSDLPRGRALSHGELRRLFEACALDAARSKKSTIGARDAALLAILYGCGLRRSEAVALDLSGYDRTTKDLRVKGKGDKQRLVYAEGGAADALDAWLKKRGRRDPRVPLFYPVDKAGKVQRRRLSPPRPPPHLHR